MPVQRGGWLYLPNLAVEPPAFRPGDIRRSVLRHAVCDILNRMSQSKTPSFIPELRLRVDTVQEAILLARLEAVRQVYNACLGEAFRHREQLLHSTVYQTAQAM